MLRPCAVKGKKRKKTEERFDREEELNDEGTSDQPENNAETEEPVKEESGLTELDGIPITPRENNIGNKPGVIFILEKASLEVAHVGKSRELLNCDEHRSYLQRKNKNPADYRPDIAHQALLMILDSPLNKAGMLKAVYLKTEQGVLIEVNPTVRIPRTFKRFCGLMSQLLQKLSVSASGKRVKLLRVIKNPVTQYLPVNSCKIGLSYSSEKLVKMRDYVSTSNDDTNFVFVVGAMSHGKIEADYIDDFVAVSQYPLSAAYCITMICQALEEKFNIL